VVTENTSEERTSQRRHGEENEQRSQHRQLTLIPSKPKPIKKQEFKAAETSQQWSKEDE
jgi:hypothetical protein